MRSLTILRRLAKQAVDQERQGLEVIGAEITDVERQIKVQQQAIEQEASASLDFMTSGVTLQAFIKAANAKIKGLESRLIQLREAHDTQLQRVQKERTEEKRYERLAERRVERARLEAASEEQKTIDEMVAISAGRRS